MNVTGAPLISFRDANDYWVNYNFTELDLKTYKGAIFLYNTHLDAKWAKFKPFLSIIFEKNATILNLLDQYQQTVKELLRVNNRMIDEISNKFPHK